MGSNLTRQHLIILHQNPTIVLWISAMIGTNLEKIGPKVSIEYGNIVLYTCITFPYSFIGKVSCGCNNDPINLALGILTKLNYLCHRQHLLTSN